MKYTAILAILTALFLAAPVQAEDGQVSRATLQSLGLGDMQVLSDDAGLAVRGMGGAGATAWGTSVVTGLLLDPNTKSFLVGTDANLSGSTASGYSKHGVVAFQNNYSYVDLALVVDTATSTYTGILFGGAGGNSFASGK